MKRFLPSSSQNSPVAKRAKVLFGSAHTYDPNTQYKFISWNVNGLKALMGKEKGASMLNLIKEERPTAICLQETKLQSSMHQQYEDILGDDYVAHFSSSTKKKGYSGTAVFVLNPKKVAGAPKVIKVTKGITLKDEDNVKQKTIDDDLVLNEGRVITVEFEDLYLVNVYVPNSGQKLERLDERTDDWDAIMGMYLNMLQKKKPVIWTGDLNCAILDIDLHDPKRNQKTAGFTPKERASFRSLLSDYNLIDSFRELNNMATVPKQYTYWGYRCGMREKDKGWRLDYFITSASVKDRLSDSYILKTVMGSDHCPIGLVMTRTAAAAEESEEQEEQSTESTSGL
jgi:exodeoxyribonuclease III